MAALTSTSHCNNLNSFLKRYNYSKQHRKSIQNAVIIPSSLSPMETLIKTSNRQTWKNKDYGRIRPRRNLEVVKCTADERQMSGAGVASPDSTLEEMKDESGYQYKLLCLMALGMYLCSANRMYLLDYFTSDTHSMSPEAAYSIQVTFQGLYIVFSVMFGALADVFGGARIMGLVFGLWFLPSILFLLVTLWFVCFFRPRFSLVWFSLIYLIPWAALQYLWDGIMTLLTPRQIHQTTITILVLPTVFGLAQSLTFPSMNVLLSRRFPITERGRAVGIVMAGMQLGNVLVFPQTKTTFGPFVCVSLVCVWLISWVCELKFYSKQRKNADSCHTNSQTPLSFPNLILKKPFWAILFANFTYNWGYFVLLLWMPFYFKNVLNVNLNEEPWFDVIPWGVMAVSSYIAGWISDYLKKAGYSLLFVHKLMQSIGFIGPGLALLCLTYAKTPKFASLLLTIAISLTPFTQVGLFLHIQDTAPYLVGLIHGITNIVGTYGATMCLFEVSNIVKRLGSYEAFLILTSMLYFNTTIFYSLCATTERII